MQNYLKMQNYLSLFICTLYRHIKVLQVKSVAK